MDHAHTTAEKNDNFVTVCVKVPAPEIPRFFPVLQSGVFLRCRTGLPLLAFLREVLLLSDAYVEDRVSTIFLNGKPVDDLETALIRDGDTVALSSAMPGLVGATMRRKGFYASFRSTITHVSGHSEVVEDVGSVRLKLFNLIMADIGPDLLKRGVFLPSEDLKAFFSAQQDDFLGRILAVEIDGRAADPIRLTADEAATGGAFVELRTCT